MKTQLFPSAVVLILVLLLNPGILWAYDWTLLNPPDPPARRHGYSMVNLPDGRVMLFGGTDEQGNFFNNLHAFDGDNWAPVIADPSPPRTPQRMKELKKTGSERRKNPFCLLKSF